MPRVKDREPRQVGFVGFLLLSHSFFSFSSPLHSLFSPLTFSNSPAESQSLPVWVLFDIAVCVFFAQCSHTATSSGKIPFVWTLRNNVDAGVWDLGACFALSCICS